MGTLTVANSKSETRGLSIRTVQIIMIAVVLILWEIIAASGLFYYGVFPSLLTIAKAFFELVTMPVFYWHLAVTTAEVLSALLIGGSVGAIVGFIFGVSSLMSRSFENYVYYVSSTPKIIFFPLVITWFGVDSGSKVGLGAIAAFFPICLNIAAGIRGINPIWIRAAKSYQASAAQIIWKVYVPAIKGALLNAIRLGLAVTIISVLLAETKLARNGIGYLVDQAYGTYNMPMMYALIIFIFIASVLLNTAIARWVGGASRDVFA